MMFNQTAPIFLVLLTPVPEPGVLALGAFGLLAISAKRRAKKSA
jgi:hypothetical protein